MSKFAEAFTAELTGDVKAKRMPRLKTDMVHMPHHPFNLSKGLRISATFAHTAWLQDTINMSEGQAIAEAAKDIRRAIVEDVFGEFRPLLTEMRTALYDADETRLRSLIAELENRMFVEGL